MPKIFRVEIVAFKTFYVEAEDKDEIHDSDVVYDECGNTGDAEWEFDRSDISPASSDEIDKASEYSLTHPLIKIR